MIVQKRLRAGALPLAARPYPQMSLIRQEFNICSMTSLFPPVVFTILAGLAPNGFSVRCSVVIPLRWSAHDIRLTV